MDGALLVFVTHRNDTSFSRPALLTDSVYGVSVTAGFKADSSVLTVRSFLVIGNEVRSVNYDSWLSCVDLHVSFLALKVGSLGHLSTIVELLVIDNIRMVDSMFTTTINSSS